MATVNIPVPPFPFLSRYTSPDMAPVDGTGAEDERKMDIGSDRETLHVSPGLLTHISVIDTHQGALDIFCLRPISGWGLPPPPPPKINDIKPEDQDVIKTLSAADPSLRFNCWYNPPQTLPISPLPPSLP